MESLCWRFGKQKIKIETAPHRTRAQTRLNKVVLYCSVGVPSVMLFYIMTPVIRGVIHSKTHLGCFHGNADLVDRTDYIQTVSCCKDGTETEERQKLFSFLLVRVLPFTHVRTLKCMWNYHNLIEYVTILRSYVCFSTFCFCQ